MRDNPVKRKVNIPKDHRSALEYITQDGEEWLPHPVYTAFYASSLGRIASLTWFKAKGWRAKLLSINQKVELTRGTRGVNYQRKQFLPHRFVWECFYGVVDSSVDTRQVAFLDGNPKNIAVTNLALVEPSKRFSIAREHA